MKNEKMNIKKIHNINTSMPRVQGQACHNNCEQWIGKKSTSSTCRLTLTAKGSIILNF